MQHDATRRDETAWAERFAGAPYAQRFAQLLAQGHLLRLPDSIPTEASAMASAMRPSAARDGVGEGLLRGARWPTQWATPGARSAHNLATERPVLARVAASFSTTTLLFGGA